MNGWKVSLLTWASWLGGELVGDTCVTLYSIFCFPGYLSIMQMDGFGELLESFIADMDMALWRVPGRHMCHTAVLCIVVHCV